MPKYQLGDIECTAVRRDDGQYQGHVVVRESVIDGRPEFQYLCPETDASDKDAIRRAMNYVNKHFPPE